MSQEMAAKMRAAFEAELPMRMKRASDIKLHPIIPAHWFAAAAAECAEMYVAGSFYGAISLAQAYVEALADFLRTCHSTALKFPNDRVGHTWRALCEGEIISSACRDAALRVFEARNKFHHLKKDVEQDYTQLWHLAAECLNLLHTIDAEIFAFTFDEGCIVPSNPEYWRDLEAGTTLVSLRQIA